MFSTLYVEKSLLSHPRTKAIGARFENIPLIPIERYGEIFNRKSQNFRLQKQAPALIIAGKQNNLVLPAPAQYGLGGNHNYYFSHLLNCIYDCRYCFLQGMYRSAHYVWFVNYEDFASAIAEKLAQHGDESCYFYSGYDCDSLALEPVTQFVDYFLPLFSRYSNAMLELRTKSTQIRSLLDRQPIDNCIVAFSFTPDNISQQLEHKVPSNEKRLEAMKKLQQKGWKVGLRFDPLIYDDDYFVNYQRLFDVVFSQIDIRNLHSVSLGVFRLPETFYRNMQRLYPSEKLFAAKLAARDGMVSYQSEIESRLLNDCESLLLKHIPDSIYYPCTME
ncbi:spore photoproduct lyase family protein [Kaarinaea lacus]